MPDRPLATLHAHLVFFTRKTSETEHAALLVR